MEGDPRRLVKMRYYTTQQTAQTSLAKIQEMLRQVGARDVVVSYDEHGRCAGVRFSLETELNGLCYFNLPLNLQGLQGRLDLLWRERVIGQRVADLDRIERIGLRCVQEWLHCQVSLFHTGMYTPAEAMFAWALRDDGQRLFDVAAEVLALPPPQRGTGGEQGLR